MDIKKTVLEIYVDNHFQFSGFSLCWVVRMHTKPLKAKVIHRHYDETTDRWDSLFSCISDRIILSEIQEREAVKNGWKL